ncbi:MAG: hypothetical protein RMY28_031455 [Nostoc sp. ChiSLP01]|nr:hypothetical protein [Nostoc sp. CmiSLP01]MDZ8283312.1 hypothetical protein [Nostoc sp. ChiSLP01]
MGKSSRLPFAFPQPRSQKLPRTFYVVSLIALESNFIAGCLQFATPNIISEVVLGDRSRHQ